MNLDQNKIRNLLNEHQEKVEQSVADNQRMAAEKIELEKIKDAKTRKERYAEVDAVISSLQERIERGIEYGQSHLRLLHLKAAELRYAPRRIGGLFSSEYVSVRLTLDSKYSDKLRGYKPNCLPDYARRLFDYCSRQGLTTLFSMDNSYASYILHPQSEHWKHQTYVLEIYW